MAQNEGVVITVFSIMLITIGFVVYFGRSNSNSSKVTIPIDPILLYAWISLIILGMTTFFIWQQGLEQFSSLLVSTRQKKDCNENNTHWYV
jgi:hypothetical protein